MTRALSLVSLVLVVSGCGAAFRPFAHRPIVWSDDDRHPFEGPPSEQYNPWAWDTIDNTVFRQISETLLYRRSREAIDVNALDEVPDSSWYTNRISRRAMSIEELQRGSCPETEPPPPPYTIVAGKTGGSSPGAVIEASDGHRYVMKTDFWGQPERGTAADAISTRLAYAAGYEVPCNFVTYVDRTALTIAPDARRRRGSTELYTEEDLEELLTAAVAGPNGTRRVSLSLYLSGQPLGGFRFSGMRSEDPNDVVPHEHRRELRAFYVMSAWMNHIDARAENNLDLWIETEEGRGYVQHLVLDAGDSFGIVWDVDIDLGMSRRFGNAHYLDFEQVLGDIASLGFADRAYRDPPRGPAYEVLGFYDVERFEPDHWRNGYPNPAFEQRTEADCAWMARILARLDESAIRAIVETGRLSRPLWREELVRILMGRRERILERYLVRLSPLSFPEIGQGELCMRDLAVESGIRPAGTRVYSASAFEGVPPRPTGGALAVRADGPNVCVSLPEGGSYHVIDLVAETPGGSVRRAERSMPARAHVATLESGERVLVGLERPSSADGF